MSHKNFPKRLDSKTSCLRITVPENLDLALEGLIRKVLREQPKTDYIHSFAADYFETLLRIRDKIGVKHSAAQLCPFHNDEDAHEMIKLASNFRTPPKKKSKERTPVKGDISERGNGTEGRNQSGGTVKSKARGSLKKGGKREEMSKQTTPDLIKKLPGSRSEEEGKKGKSEEGEGKEENEEELLTGDPIKELVEKELKMAGLAQKTEPNPGEIQKQSAQKESSREEGETKGVIEEADVRREDQKRNETKEESANNGKIEVSEKNDEKATAKAEELNDLTEQKGVDDSSSATHGEKISCAEEAKDKMDAKEVNEKPSNAENADSGDLRAADTIEVEVILGDEKSIEIVKEETEMEKKEDVQKMSTDGTETKKMEGDTSTEVADTNASVDDKLPVAEKETDSETTNENTDRLKTLGTEVEDEGKRAKTDSEEARREEKEPENDRQIIKGDGTEGQPEADPSKEHRISEDKAPEFQVTQERGKDGDKTEDNSAIGEDVTSEALNDNTAKDANKTSPLLENIYENKIGDDEKKEQVEPRTDLGTEGKELEKGKTSPKEEQGDEISPEMTEKEKPKEAEKPETEEVITSDGEITGNAREIAANAEVEDAKLAKVEAPTEEEKPSPVKAEKDSNDSSLKQVEHFEEDEEKKEARLEEPKDKKTEDFVKEDTPVKDETPAKEEAPIKEEETPVKEEVAVKAEAPVEEEVPVKKEAAVKEEAVPGKEEEGKVVPSQPSSNGPVEPEKGEAVKEIPEPERKESQNEEPEEELCTVVDIHQIPPHDNEKSQRKENAQEPEEELCTVVDSHHIIKIEEPQATNDSSEAPQRPEELQIKTIQTHYYDTLQVPEIVTKELRIHNVSDGLSVAPFSLANDLHPVIPSETAQAIDSSPTEKNAEPALQEEEASSSEKSQPAGHPNAVPLSVGTLNQHDSAPDARRTEIDDMSDLMTPTSGYSLNLSELSWQTVSGMFLDSERQHSARLSDEFSHVTPKVREQANEPEEREEGDERRPEIEEVFHKTVLPTLVGAEPIPPRNAEEIDKEENTQDKVEKKKKPEEDSFGGSTNGRSFDSDTPFISVEVKTVIETQILDDDDEGERHPQLELKVETTVDVEDIEEPQRDAERSTKEEEKEMSDGEQRERSGGAKEGSGEGEESGELGGGGREGSSGESESTISSAATEIKRSDSGRRAVGKESSWQISQSLDLGGRNPLLRTRSLSTFRHGVTDFEVWSAIEKELEEAATKIQARFRSYKARKKLQREDAVQITTEESSPSTTPAESDDRQRSTGEFHDSIVLSDHPR